MKINQISVVFFSATGRTRRAAEQVASALPLAADWLDITPHAADGLARSFGPDELVVWAAPVYGGRLALQAAQRFARLKGKQTPAVLLAVPVLPQAGRMNRTHNNWRILPADFGKRSSKRLPRRICGCRR